MTERLSRRDLLATVGVAATGGVAGCLSRVPFTGRSIDEDGLPASTTATTEFRGDLHRRGVYPDATIPEDPTIEWAIRDVNTGDHTAAKASPVAIPGGDVLIAGDTGEIRRVTPDGEVRWTAAVDPTSRGIHGTPAIANGTVYVGAYDGALYAFDLDSGDRFWRQKLGDAIGSSPGYHDGVVYIAVEYAVPSGAMFGVDAVTGEVVWDDHRPTDHPHSTAAIDLDAGRLVVGSNDGDLYAWTYPARTFDWRFSTDGAIKGPIATVDGSAIFGSWDERVYRVDLTDGAEVWSVDTGGMVMSGPAIEPATETVYVGSHDGNLYALDLATGDERWRFDAQGRIIGCPTVTAEHVLVGSYDRHCYAVDKKRGEETWRVQGVGRVSSTPLVADGAVYFADRASPAFLDDGSGRSGGLYKVGPIAD
ncbi:WD40/PQQ-like beta propeller repeat containing protein [Halanaeroarchaeum sp. HSR-CO]|uniref:outer membrane protein assembly factor BamB family protein n=1 Tax=Halanaeroarchaeum sp. HSR-CO TaxID=2866382 RepID=UPI00217E4D82|nr:PQQ-binding-like beta-propeller repeat protein [Halanaeroarchaeum sp. HSR-CO]UWG46681.1 WD40/PQQ-like beta propeller repeat containing protein [Halanaeroarchaeum sp. HSR-CO]